MGAILAHPIISALVATSTAGTAATISSQQQAAKKAKSQANAAAEQAQKEAEQKALMETQTEEKNTAARRALLDIPTSGFGPNKNLARSFLTTL